MGSDDEGGDDDGGDVGVAEDRYGGPSGTVGSRRAARPVGGGVVARGRRGRTLAAGCVLALTATLLGCDAGGGAEDPAPSTSPTDPSSAASGSGTPEGPVELTLAVHGDDAVLTAYERIAATFVGQAPEVDVEVARYPDADAIASAVGSGAGPDVFLLEQHQLAEMVEAGATAPLDEALDERGLQFGDDFQRSALTTFSAEAQLQCMPVETSPLVVYWNRELVPRQRLEAQDLRWPRGPANWSWETFEAAARAVAERDLLGPVKGTWVPPRLDLLTAWLRSSGEDVVDDDLDPQTLQLSSEGAVETLEAVVRLASDPAVSLTPTDLARRDAVGWFSAGELGLLVGTRADLPRLRNAAERRGLDFGVVSLPSFGRATSISEARALCVNADTGELDAAVDLVAWAVGPRGARIAAASGQLVPSRLDTLTSVAFRDPAQPPRRPEVFAAGAKRSEPLPYSPLWPTVTALVEERLERLFSPRSAELGLRALTRRLARLDEESQVVLGGGSEDPDEPEESAASDG